MSRLSCCQNCLYYSGFPGLICAVHPDGPQHDYCPDFDGKASTDASELWQPIGARFDGDELVVDVVARYQREQCLALLDTHPLFTGRCPQCELPIIPPESAVHWDCPHCGWIDDSL